MADIRRVQSQARTLPADRDGRTEALLVEGLDQYFKANYEEAIHLWTRVLFLDRTHARARAYIARARTAIGERQRRADEMLHSAGELIGRGELDQARRVLSQVEQLSGADEKVAELWARFERVARAARDGQPPAVVAAVVDVVPLRTWKWGAVSTAWLVAAAAVGALIATAAVSPAVRDWFADEPGRPSLPASATAPGELPTLTSGEVALVRARTLYARGRLAEALAALGRTDAYGTNRTAAEALRADIQRWLLAPRRGDTNAASTIGGAP